MVLQGVQGYDTGHMSYWAVPGDITRFIMTVSLIAEENRAMVKV